MAASPPTAANALGAYRIVAPPPLDIVAEPEPPGVRLRLYGEVDLATVGTIGRRIDECAAAGDPLVILDLQGVTFLDCTGVRLALQADAAAQAAGWEFVLIEAGASVQRVFELAGARDRLRFVNAPKPGGATRRLRVVRPSAGTRRPEPARGRQAMPGPGAPKR